MKNEYKIVEVFDKKLKDVFISFLIEKINK